MASDIWEGRLHPATLVTALIDVLRRAATSFLPLLVIAVISGRGPKGGVYTLIFIGLSAVGLLFSLGFALIRYFTFTYRIDEGELQTQEGLWWKHERRIPLQRIQDVRLTQSVLQRIFKVAEVQVETAGGAGAEAQLSVISLDDAERLRTYLFARRDAAPTEATSTSPLLDFDLDEGDAPAVPIVAAPVVTAVPEVVLREATLKDLAIAGLTQNWFGTALAGAGGMFFWLREYLPRREQSRLLKTGAETANGWLHSNGLSLGIALATAGILMVLIGVTVSIVRTIILFYGFKLTRTGEDLGRSWGMFTRHVSRLPRRRIQVVEIEQSPLRRFVGVALLRADTAGSIATRGQEGAHNTGRDVLVPLLPRADVDSLLPELFPGVALEPPHWHSISPLAIRREAMPGIWLCLIVSLGVIWALRATVVTAWPLGLLPLLGIPLFWWTSRAGWKQLGWALDGGLFRTRRGILSRSEHLVPLRNLQVVKVRQSPFDRRLRLLSLHVDTAGQTLTGGGPRLDHVPQEEGWELVRTLAQEAQRQRFRWEK